MKAVLAEMLVKGAAKLGVALGEKEVTLYFKYLELLLEWNEEINLTTINNPEEIVVKHFLDSLSLFPYLPKKTDIRFLDVGTGAGFPGVPIKIANPKINVVLLDSLNKRVVFLKSLISELKLNGITIIHGRAEDIGHQAGFRESFDVVASRAVARLSVLAELCIPFVRVGGIFVAYKSRKAAEEIAEAKVALETMGGKLSSMVEIKLPGIEDRRNLVIIEKEKPTLGKYPRKAGIPEKRPLR